MDFVMAPSPAATARKIVGFVRMIAVSTTAAKDAAIRYVRTVCANSIRFVVTLGGMRSV